MGFRSFSLLSISHALTLCLNGRDSGGGAGGGAPASERMQGLGLSGFEVNGDITSEIVQLPGEVATAAVAVREPPPLTREVESEDERLHRRILIPWVPINSTFIIGGRTFLRTEIHGAKCQAKDCSTRGGHIFKDKGYAGRQLEQHADACIRRESKPSAAELKERQ